MNTCAHVHAGALGIGFCEEVQLVFGLVCAESHTYILTALTSTLTNAQFMGQV